jgi:OOP family OmpA-OmpF porin
MPAAPLQMQGPMLPVARDLTLTPAALGASEEFQTLDEREESIRVPVLTPTAETPRPSARPDGVSEAAEDATDE